MPASSSPREGSCRRKTTPPLIPEQIQRPGSPRTTARPPVLHSHAKPRRSPPNTTSAPERRMPARASAPPCTRKRPRCAPYPKHFPTEPSTKRPSALRALSTATAPPSAVFAAPSCAPPRSVSATPCVAYAAKPFPAIEPSRKLAATSSTATPAIRIRAGALLAQRGEEAAEVVDRALEFARLEPLYAALGRLRDGVELCRDPDVAGVELAAAADRAADRDHGERAEANAIRAEAEHLRHVVRALHAAVAPNLDEVTQARRDERAMRLRDADLRGKPGAPERVLARRPGAAVVSREGHDVRTGLGDADRDDPDVRHDRHLHRDPGARIHRLELVHDLREILDGVDVVVVRGRDEVHARLRVPRERDLRRDLARGEMPALAGLRALADLDLEVVR